MERDANEYGVQFTRVRMKNVFCLTVEDNEIQVVAIDSFATKVARIEGIAPIEQLGVDGKKEL